MGLSTTVKFAFLDVFMFICLYLACVSIVSCSINPYPPIKQVPVRNVAAAGNPLFLTPLIEAGKIKEARSAAKVLPLPGDEGIKSYAGYLTVNKQFNSNLFFWFFPSETNFTSDPVVLWLQGGPGASSMYGLFTENGPFSVGINNKLVRRKYAWSQSHSVIYIDNPVGTGYSFTDGGYARNETAVGKDLYNALLQFFTLFPELQENAFFVTGESYGGKYVPAVSYTIHKNNPQAELKINFQGMAIGNGLSDPVHMLKYGDYLYQLGLIDSNAREAFHQQEALGVKYIEEKEWDKAFDVFDALLNGDMYPSGSFFHNITGFDFYFNFLHDKDYSEGGDMGTYIQQEIVRNAIHVGNMTFHTDNTVEINLKQDVMQSVKPWVEELLEHYRVLVYNGQLDIIVAYPLTVSYLQTLQWSSTAAYKTAPRYQWRVDKELAGYVKHAGNLTEILVRNAGHMVPLDQPKWASDLINRFTAGKGFH
ncbi:venom serine carboxypeptidase [Anabrus simplex]|uniref:venom serine carboxypeptidase n=1 Tax=Anabrus simplex TaxID=316456 RepID=UPI0035A2BAE3